MQAWLVTAIVGFSLACNSKPTEQASARSAEPAAPKAANSRTHRADLLRRLDDALRKAAPNIAARLRPGATDSQIAAFETYLGYPVPEALRDLYRWHDGVETVAGGRYDPPDLFFGYWMMSLDELQKTHARKTTMWKDGTYAKTDRGGAGWWDEHWIPFLEQIQGGTICVDTAGWSTGHIGQVLEEWHDDSLRELVYRDLDAWLETFVTALETGVLHKMSDGEAIGAGDKIGYEGPGFERWVAYHAKHNPGYPIRLRAEGGH
ncbi:MAG: SMI1/KNR4 family protein [Myxococcota bacterium]|nr:SMI1/KNR4 family protein [Myxococcota bacterium]